ncbi:MAG: Uma2 family endonuclease [Proteobacteria bacterium]|nr:Uma2 family endonuclease [Pseudomonadota bacterium]
MGQAQEVAPLNREAYLAWEATQEDRHEYIAGEVFAMVGVRREHARVALAVASRLRAHLKGSRCQTFISDMKLFVAAADAFFYPDVMVTCDERDRHADLAMEHPKFIVEVLSDSTAAYDRGAKFAAYRKLADLSEYLLIDIEHRRLELYRREADHWLMFETEPDGPALQLASVDMPITAREAFEDLED